MSIWKKAPAEKALKHSSGARWARPALLPPQAFDDPLPAVRGGAARPAGREQRAARA